MKVVGEAKLVLVSFEGDTVTWIQFRDTIWRIDVDNEQDSILLLPVIRDDLIIPITGSLELEVTLILNRLRDDDTLEWRYWYWWFSLPSCAQCRHWAE